MAQEKYIPIKVTSGAFGKLKRRKLRKQASLGKEITWDEFFLAATKR